VANFLEPNEGVVDGPADEDVRSLTKYTKSNIAETEKM
jgi:hypothetical protein